MLLSLVPLLVGCQRASYAFAFVSPDFLFGMISEVPRGGGDSCIATYEGVRQVFFFFFMHVAVFRCCCCRSFFPGFVRFGDPHGAHATD